MVKKMKRFKSSKKPSLKFKIISFMILFSIGFYYVFSYFISPETILENLKERYFNDHNIITYYINDLFGSPKEDMGFGKTKYIADPTPLENKINPVVYLYSSHQTEEYYADLLMEHDIMPSVMTASYILREKLNNLKINTMVETNDINAILTKQNWNYSKSYDASRLLLEQVKINHPTLDIFIDIHRDSIPYENSTLVTNDLSYAKVLFVIGTEHENYQENEAFASQISEAMNNLVPNISKGILEKNGQGNNGVYNQDFSSKTILIEVGSSYNYIAEVTATMDILAKSLASVVGEQNG